MMVIMFVVVTVVMAMFVVVVMVVHYDLGRGRWKVFVHLMGVMMVVFVDWHHNFNMYTIYKRCLNVCRWFE